MREIKFRGKLIDIDEWVYGNYDTSIEDGDNGGTEIYYREINTLLTYVNSQLVYPETVGQYTGLKDRQGVEIYEGDVLDYDNGIGIKGIVKWYEDGFAIGILGAGDASNKSLYQSTEDIEVIGNIHENPELLKEGE
ncbi:MAG: YopX family protein [Clostridium tyrobutyricum]|jgi:uncharacterized phage protein (TIGR01671 family)|uniref:YopX family protein n=1 Tax=Clostridium tyrobutyricum TaxID=1519 RepID=UPI0010AA0F46|nr:YopX family protein [Clostridium tyrobutyricum]MBV4430708.1 YopX family protein [Clostridium tyrobutyricum]MBV4439400.1 YopX family protein [Clostridium tyrobutyricum]MBV4447958.1 YopX family protein [Clostridium tyrobutyricum]MCH4199242.1 YopX family protein [Clostridium tyrobutyricum]MCH4236574.1 YopX family protein [Clostridium tyrobutyricum]